MKKYIIAAAVLFSFNVLAQDNLNLQKLKVINKLYADPEMAKDKLLKFASQDLKAVFAEDEQHIQGTSAEIGCIDYSVTLQGQDFDYQEIQNSLKKSITSKGDVLVTFTNLGTTHNLVYVMQCQNNHCTIDDILEERQPFKKKIRECLKRS